MIELTARTYGDAQQLGSMIQGLSGIARDLRGAFPAVATRFHQQMARRFREEGASGPSGAWAPLDPDYAAVKARRYPNAGILVASGEMEESLTSFGGQAIVEYGPTSVFIGSELEYPTYHQTGTENMPQRRVIEPNDRDASEWVVEIWRYYMGQGSRLGWSGRFAGAMA